MLSNSKKIKELYTQSLEIQKEQSLTISSLEEEKEKLKKEIEVLQKDKERSISEKKQLLNQIDKLKFKKDEEKLSQKINDKGYLTLQGFKLVAPILDKVLGRPFMITVAEEFNYTNVPDSVKLQENINAVSKMMGESFHCFRDEVKPGYSFRTTYGYSTKDYYFTAENGQKVNQRDVMFPANLDNGIEISNYAKSAMYLALKEKTIQSAVLPANLFGAPLLSYAIPIFSEENELIGAISFSNDISQIVNIGKSLGSVVSSKSDLQLHQLANILKEELTITEKSLHQINEEGQFTQKSASYIQVKGKEIMGIAERLKVLALNTAIESSKVGHHGKGVGIIANQMKEIAEVTRKTLKEVFDKSKDLLTSSNKVSKISDKLKESSTKLKDESSMLFNTSIKITDQKDELASLVRLSIDEIAQSQDELNGIFALIKAEQQKK